jgi:hypothetical protein
VRPAGREPAETGGEKDGKGEARGVHAGKTCDRHASRECPRAKWIAPQARRERRSVVTRSREERRNPVDSSVRPRAVSPAQILFSSPAFRAACHVLRDMLPGVEGRDGRSGRSGSTRSFPRPRSFPRDEYREKSAVRNSDPRFGLGIPPVEQGWHGLDRVQPDPRAARPDLQSG